MVLSLIGRKGRRLLLVACRGSTRCRTPLAAAARPPRTRRCSGWATSPRVWGLRRSHCWRRTARTRRRSAWWRTGRLCPVVYRSQATAKQSLSDARGTKGAKPQCAFHGALLKGAGAQATGPSIGRVKLRAAVPVLVGPEAKCCSPCNC